MKDSVTLSKIHRNFDDDVWELYKLDDDFNEMNNLAQKNPEKLKELKAQFDADATANHLYPLIDWDDALHKRFHQTAKPFNPASGKISEK